MTQANNGIVLVGLGPGDPNQITLEAWRWLEGLSEVYLRTRRHPTVDALPAALTVHSFDEVYESGERFEAVYAEIVERVLALGRRPEGVTYAVPGHPFVAETTCPEIARRARQEGIPVRVIEGVSFLEPTFTALELDPFTHLVLVDGLDLVQRHVPPFSPAQAVLISQIYSRQVASDVKLTLSNIYPDQHPVRLVHAAGTDRQKIEDLALYEIDRSPQIGLLTALYVPPLPHDTSFENFHEVIAHLRAPDGCPWDREQTLQSLLPSLIEEAYEALDAFNDNNLDGLREELGDVLMVIFLLAQIAYEDGAFTLADVTQGVYQKIVFRHPHVFSDTSVEGTSEVLRNWEVLKEQERAKKGKSKTKGILDGLPKVLPALSLAQSYQERAAHVGFDWHDISGVIDKILEEWQEVQEAAEGDDRRRELGDLLFAVVNLVRWNQGDAEAILRAANQRFKKRFNYIEQHARDHQRALTDMTLDEMEALWQQAKQFDQ